MLRPSRLLVLTAMLTASLLAKELPRPTNPNPGLKYYYPVPLVAEPKTYDFDVVIYGASPAAVSAASSALCNEVSAAASGCQETIARR